MNTQCSYKVKARTLIKNDKTGEIQFKTFEKDFRNQNPILAREEAFKVFHEYLYGLLVTLGFTDREIGWNQEERRIERISNREIRRILSPFLSMENDYEFLKTDDFAPSHGGAWYNDHANGVWLIFTIEDIAYKEKNNIDEEGVVIDSITNFGGKLPSPPWSSNLEQEYEFYLNHEFDTKHYEQDVTFFDDEEFNAGDPKVALRKFTCLKTTFDWNGYDDPDWWKTEDELLKETIEQALQRRETFYDSYKKGESDTVEFKPYLVNLQSTERNIEFEIAKTIAAFANSNGGFLYIGLNDEGIPIGLNFNGLNKDKFLNQFTSIKRFYLPDSFVYEVTGIFIALEGKEVFLVSVYPAPEPIFLKKRDEKGRNVKEFYARADASSRHIYDIEEMLKYCKNKWFEKL